MRLKVLTQEGIVFEKEVQSVIAPGSVGYLGVWQGHSPLLTTLKEGKLIWTLSSQVREQMRVKSGLLEVVDDRITAVVASVENVEPALQ